MKSIFRYIIFAAAALSAVLAACSKDTAVEGNPGTAEGNQGLRTIILQFSPGTKAAFDGIKSSFVDGDVIKLSNATQSADATVQVVNGVASITTALTGNLTAVYPSTAANATGTNPIGTPAYKVPSVQDGTLEKTVIAVANITGPSAVFELQTALFQITPPSTAKQIIIKSLKPVEDGVARTGTAAEINTEGTDKTVITVGTGSANLPNPFYVILKPGVKLTDLSFDAGETIGMKGIPESAVTTRATALGKTFADLNVVAIGNAYQINNTNWHPYVTIGGKKWATMNIGATTVAGSKDTCFGTYFAWGGTKGQEASTKTTGVDVFIHEFDLSNYPFAVGGEAKFNKYVPEAQKSDGAGGTFFDDKTTLELVDDAAYANWGGPWRMPTGGTAATADFIALAGDCDPGINILNSTSITLVGSAESVSSKGIYFCSNYSGSDGISGLLFYYDGTIKLFFPITGCGYDDKQLHDIGCGLYWANTLNTTNIREAYYLLFYNSVIFLKTSNRHNGFPVRPVADYDNFEFESYIDKGSF